MNKYELSRLATKLLKKHELQIKEKQSRKKMKKVSLRKSKTEKADSQLAIIHRAFSDVEVFTKIHIRINRVVDVWPTTGRFYNRVTHTKGKYFTVADLMNQVENAEMKRANPKNFYASNQQEIE